MVKASQADLGVAFDGDADRCLAVDEDGTLVNGDQIMGILARAKQREGKLNHNTREHGLVGLGGHLVYIRHIDELLRQLREVRGEALEAAAGIDDLLAQRERGEGAVAGRGEFTVDDVARLFAAERIVALEHLFEHVAVADVGLQARTRW